MLLRTVHRTQHRTPSTFRKKKLIFTVPVEQGRFARLLAGKMKFSPSPTLLQQATSERKKKHASFLRNMNCFQVLLFLRNRIEPPILHSNLSSYTHMYFTKVLFSIFFFGRGCSGTHAHIPAITKQNTREVVAANANQSIYQSVNQSMPTQIPTPMQSSYHTAMPTS